ncbi:unnamed protein product, partial [Mesorhabditis spiculigera]
MHAGQFIVTAIAIFGLLAILIAVPVYLNTLEHPTELLQQQDQLRMVASENNQKYVALQKFIRIAKNAVLTKKEWSDIVYSYSQQAYPNETSFVLGTSSIHSKWTVGNAAVQIMMNMFLTNMRTMTCYHSTCRLAIGVTAILGAILVSLVLASMVEVYRSAIRMITELVMPKVDELKKNRHILLKRIMTKEVVTLVLTMALAFGMFSAGVVISKKENNWTTSAAVSYNLHLASGVGYVKELPTYLEYDQVSASRALFIFCQFLWLTTPLAALFGSIIGIFRGIAIGIDYIEDAGELQRYREKECNRTAPRTRALYHN